MANKKVSQLTSKPAVNLTDLFLIADPTSGQAFKTTISDLGTAIGSGVSSVNTLVGAVVLDTDDIQELVSPTNRWFTDTRARAAISGGTGISYNSGTGVITNAVTSGQIATALGYTPADGANYLPLAGGTMGGAIFGTIATFASSTSVTALGITLSGASGDGVKITHSAGRAFNIQSSGSGFGILINNETASTSAPFTIQKQGLDVISMTDAGAGSFASSLTASSFIRSGGTSSQFLKADGSVDSTSYQPLLTNPISGTGTSGQVAYFNGTNSITSNASFAFTPTSQLLVNNSVTAASAIARGTNLTPMLVASANNDVLVGLDINPTFTNNAFTGVTQIALRLNNAIQLTGTPTSTSDVNVVYNNSSASTICFIAGATPTSNSTTGSFITMRGNTYSAAANQRGTVYIGAGSVTTPSATEGAIRIYGGSTVEYVRQFANGNWLFQNGGTFTDAGFRLDVNGTARVQGNTTITGGNLFLPNNNTVGGTNYYIGQNIGDDYWRIYGNLVATDKGEMVFDIGDNGSSFASGGQRFRFFYSATNDGTAKSPLIIDYNDSTFLTTLTANSFIKSGGTSSQFLKADGSVDSSTYLPLSGGTLTGPLIGTSGKFSKSSNSGSGSSFPRFEVENTLATQGDGSSTFNFADLRIASGNGAVDMFLSPTYAAGTWAPAAIINVSTNHDLQFKTNNTERMRITSGGYLKLREATSSTTAVHILRADTTSDAVVQITNENTSNASDGMLTVVAQRNTTNNTFYSYGYYNIGASAWKFRVADSGNVTNTNNSYGAISDIKLKENISDATSKLSDLLKIKIKNFNYIGSNEKQLGVIAQEVEEVFPGLVEIHTDRDKEGNDLGTVTKSVKYSVFVPMLIKAIQEQQAQIEELKNK